MTFKVTATIGLALIFLSKYAVGAVVWGWEIDNPNVIVASNEKVVFYATIYNNITSETLNNLDTNLPEEVDLSFLSGTLDTSLLTLNTPTIWVR